MRFWACRTFVDSVSLYPHEGQREGQAGRRGACGAGSGPLRNRVASNAAGTRPSGAHTNQQQVHGETVLLMPIRQMRRGSTGWYRCSAPSEAMLHPRSHTVHRQIGGGREPCLGWHDVLVLVQGPSNPHEEKGPHQLRGSSEHDARFSTESDHTHPHALSRTTTRSPMLIFRVGLQAQAHEGQEQSKSAPRLHGRGCPVLQNTVRRSTDELLQNTVREDQQTCA